MKLIEFPEQMIIVAKDQPQYNPMPAHFRETENGTTMTCCWQLSPEEIEEVSKTGLIWHQIVTFLSPIQPQLLSVDKPDL